MGNKLTFRYNITKYIRDAVRKAEKIFPGKALNAEVTSETINGLELVIEVSPTEGEKKDIYSVQSIL